MKYKMSDDTDGPSLAAQVKKLEGACCGMADEHAGAILRAIELRDLVCEWAEARRRIGLSRTTPYEAEYYAEQASDYERKFVELAESM